MTPDDISALSYEKALEELDQIIERLERGAVALDEAIAAYERGARLAQHCASLLDRTEQKISQLVVGGGGRLAEKPFEAETALTETPGPAIPGLGLVPARGDRLPIDPDDIPF